VDRKIVIILSVIESEGLFVEVAKQMKRFNGNISSFEASFEKTPEVFESVGMDASVDVSFGVVDDLMHIFSVKPFIGQKSIGIQSRSFFHVVADFFLKQGFPSIDDNLGSDLSAALQNSHDCGFIPAACSADSPRPFRRVHVAGFAADESFIHFHFNPAPAEFPERSCVHGEADSVEHVPSGLLGDAKSAVDFVAADAVLAVCDHPNGGKPLVQTERGILEDGSDLDGKLTMRMDAFALPFPLIGKESNIGSSACGAGNAFRPTASYHVFPAVVRIGKVDDCFSKCSKFIFVFHVYNVTILSMICQVYYCPC